MWKEIFRKKKFRIEFIISILALILILTILANFLNFLEAREGVVLNDPILKLFKPVDLTWLSFGLIYISLFAALISFYQNPLLLLNAFQSYTLLIAIRIMSMYLVPLNPPETMIPLNDPVVEFFGTGQLLTKDLFFSGHTATIFLLYLLADKKLLKTFFLVSAIVVGIGVLLQHVHYSIDVFVAPFFAYCSFYIVKK